MFGSHSAEEWDLVGLHLPVEIVVDKWGVSHIYAQDDHDLYVAQGFNAARDRLFQIDVARRRGLALLAEVLGSQFTEQDRATRLLLFRGDMDAEWASYGDQARDVITNFVTGINEYVRWVTADITRLPPEFDRWGFAPSFWQPEDVVRSRTHGLFYNVEHEVARAATIREGGVRAERVRQKREPDDPYQLPIGVDLDDIDDRLLEVYRLAFKPVALPLALDPSPEAGRPTVGSPNTFADAAGGGSNNWVVGGGRTKTRRPLLANDPHRAITLPSLRYIAHLESPTTHLIGGGEPAPPGISIGHNGHVAFGLTIWFADQEDLYVYELDPEEPSRYRYGDGWELMHTIHEEVAVAGEASRKVSLQFTRHGPVIFLDSSRNLAVALRAAWLEPGMMPLPGQPQVFAQPHRA